MSTTIRARAPLRLGLAGGGTDVAPFPQEYGGYVLNATINRFAFASISLRDDRNVCFSALDLDRHEALDAYSDWRTQDGLILHRGVYNRMIRDFNGGQPCPLTLHTSCDSPIGSGLGSSSALVVAMVTAFAELFKVPLGEYGIARLAFDIERRDLALAGGGQDQYAATFGGFNFMEFGPGERVVVNPLRVRNTITYELEASVVLLFTGVSRESATIIDQQARSVSQGGKSLEAMQDLKRHAMTMKEAILFGDLKKIADVLSETWNAKKRTSTVVSNTPIDDIFELALSSGAMAGKISGAGGGGFIMFLADPLRRDGLMRVLGTIPGSVISTCHFATEGATAWRL